TRAGECVPCADVVPVERGAHDTHPVAALEQTVVDRERRRAREELVDTTLVEQRKQRRQLGRMLLQLREQKGDRPDEESCIPEETVGYIALGGRTVGFLDECVDDPGIVGERASRSDVAVPRLGTRRCCADREEPLLRARELCR